ncbi:MAG: alpha/beta hydrolase [Firmicutes bacterium]|nr:alpha/beta hydrolase [Bacillota bacterium]
MSTDGRHTLLRKHAQSETNAAGLDLVFIHGLGASANVWENQVNYFGDDNRIWLAELCGHGEAPPLRRSLFQLPFLPQDDCSIDQMAAEIAEDLEKNQTDRAVLVGHSLGGAIAVKLAADYPDRARALVLIDTPVVQKAKWIQKRLAMNVFRRHFQRTVQQIFAMMCEKADTAQRVIADALKADKNSFISLIKQVMDMDLSDELSRISVPTLLVLGSRMAKTEEKLSVFLSAQGYDELTDKTVEYRSDVGHYIMLEKPEWLNKLMAEFLTKLTSST